jgi:CspA family cold shock protein
VQEGSAPEGGPDAPRPDVLPLPRFFGAHEDAMAGTIPQDYHIRRTMTGKIRTLRTDKGFGFIKDDKGNEYFFHRSAVYGEGLEDLREGDSVEFEVGEGPKGPRAENVRRTST